MTHGRMQMEAVRDMVMQKNYDTDPDLWNENVARALYEHCKMLQCSPSEKRKALDLASHITANLVAKNAAEQNYESSPQIQERTARFLLTLSDWAQHDGMQSKHLKRLVNSLSDIGEGQNQSLMHGVMSTADTTIGKLLMESTNQCPNLAKSWLKLGGWFYRWGRKIVEQKTGAHGNKLTTFDIVSIQSIVPTISEQEILLIGDIFHEHQASAEEEDISTTNDSNTTEVIEQQLRRVSGLSCASKETIQAIIEVWKQAHKTIYSYYEKSAESYFRFLQVACSGPMNEDKIECK